VQLRALWCMGWLWLGLGLVPVTAVAAPADEHLAAIELARGGDFPAALQRLEELRQRQPENRALAFDQLVVYAWAERDAEVVDLAQRTPLDQAPGYVLVAAAKAYRNQKFFPEAAALYRRALERSPDQLQARIGLAYALADAGELEPAEVAAAQLRSERPREIEVLMLSAYLFERARRYVEAIDAYQRVLALAPGHKGARYSYLLALNAVGAPHLALEQGTLPPRVLGPNDWRRLRGSEAAHEVRWGELPPRPIEERFFETDQALELLARNLQELDPEREEDRPFIQQARFDRLVALRDRVQMSTVVEEYEELQTAGVTLPLYALAAAADAYLYLEQPEQAHALYSQVLQASPGDVNAGLGRFYALIEMEDFPAALAQVDALDAALPIWTHPGGSKAARRSPGKLDAEIAATLGRSFAGDLDGAQLRFEQMRQLAPQNPDLRHELAGVYAARGWPRRAQEGYGLGLNIEPEHRGMQTGLAATRLRLNEFASAETAILQLARRYPEAKPVQRLERSWQLHNLRELQVEAAYGRSGGSAVASRDLLLESTLYSRPLHYHYRGLVSASWNRGEFPEGVGIVQRYGLGFDYRRRDFEGEAALTLVDAADTNPGLRLGGTWMPDDYWAFPAQLELISRETPTRALRSGIQADSLRLGARHRWSELRQASGQLQLLSFSDGNLRTSASAALRQRLQTRAQRWHDLELGLYASTNRNSDGPYYSPSEDASAELTLDNSWRLWRRYTRSFRHRLALTAGGYWQNHQGVKPVGAALYEHLWQNDEAFELVYGAALTRRVYDGEGENGSAYYLRLNWRL
jgi:biofilm PGA synthesis protein PgaA